MITDLMAKYAEDLTKKDALIAGGLAVPGYIGSALGVAEAAKRYYNNKLVPEYNVPLFETDPGYEAAKKAWDNKKAAWKSRFNKITNRVVPAATLLPAAAYLAYRKFKKNNNNAAPAAPVAPVAHA